MTATAEGQTAPNGEEGAAEGLRPGAARFSAARTAAAQGARPEAETPNVAVAARGGNGNGNGGNGGGNGHGNGGGGNGGGGNGGNGGGNGGNGGGGRGGELTFEIRPDVWNTNWVHAEGNVQAFVRGRDVAKIDTASVELEVDGDTLAPKSVRVAGGQLVATFAKSDAFELLGDDVHSGDRVTVTLNLKVGDEAKELEDQIRVVGKDPDDDGGGDDEGGEVELNIQPDDWNVNWERSSGQVHAFLRGDLKDVKLDSIRLVGDKADAEALKPLDARRVGKQIVARFSKSAAFKTLDDPDAGETHTVKIRFSQGDAEKELSEDVHIVGPQ
ncbi:MAG TPA: hypothetical protein VHC97_04185 [Thermoanaerobaculia bacterium]|nr:hypothetical protein [Thermoanaerobaculia bacterium]